MKIVRVITRLNAGGPSFQAEHLSRALARRGHETLLVHGALSAGEHPEPERWRLAPRRIQVPQLIRKVDPARDLAAFRKLLRIFKAERPDVVHTHHAKAGALGRLAARLAGVKTIVHTYHGNIFSGYFAPSAERIVLAIERWLAGFTNALVAISPSQLAELTGGFRIAPREKFRMVPLGLDLAPFLEAKAPDPTLRRELGLPVSGPVVVIAARLDPVKDVARFLDIAAVVARSVPEARFLVAGDGRERADLEQRARHLGIADRVVFAGMREDLPAVFSLCDVVCLTSKNEGTPASLIEAMAAGRAVAAHAVGGVTDVVEDGRTGVLVLPGDPGRFAGAVVELLKDPGRRDALGAAARESVPRRYGAERLAQEIEELYRELISPASR